jgi:hypothetical protein
MALSDIPEWLKALNEEDLHFLKRFLLVSGSLKDLAKEYGISYPTIRARLDKLIEKVEVAEIDNRPDAFQRAIQHLVSDGLLIPSVARQLLSTHRNIIKQVKEGEADNA